MQYERTCCYNFIWFIKIPKIFVYQFIIADIPTSNILLIQPYDNLKKHNNSISEKAIFNILAKTKKDAQEWLRNLSVGVAITQIGSKYLHGLHFAAYSWYEWSM